MQQTFISFFRNSLLLTLLGISLSVRAQTATSNSTDENLFIDSLQISLITCGPGEDLYSTFGHSAVRVQDYTTGGDYVFNYGTFDFSTPHFYLKFVRGRLMYFLSVQNFKDFIGVYVAENRKVTEQVLQLSPTEKEAVFQFLQHNYQPTNRYYKYDFLFDNCSTRIRDIFTKLFGKDNLEVTDIIPEEDLTFRQIIDSYLRKSPWERLGINLMFGKKADQQMTNMQIMFLPYYLMEGMDHATLNGKPLVENTATLYTPTPHPESVYPFYKYPLFWFSLGAVFIVLLSFSKSAFSRLLLPWVDRCLFFLTGLLGCFLVFMWLGTDHQITVWNFNILWLLPFNLIFSFYFYKNTPWVRNYAILLLCINIIILAGWYVLPQQLPLVAIPVIVVLSVRAWQIISPSRFGR